MEAVIIVGLIVAYCAYVIYRKVRNMKAGKFCSCDCSGCSAHQGSCSSQSKAEEIKKA